MTEMAKRNRTLQPKSNEMIHLDSPAVTDSTNNHRLCFFIWAFLRRNAFVVLTMTAVVIGKTFPLLTQALMVLIFCEC